MKNAVPALCMAFVALVWSSLAQAQGYAGVMAPADGSSGKGSGSSSSTSSVYAYSAPAAPTLPATGYAGVMGGDGTVAPTDYKAAKAKRSEEIRLMNEAARQERNARLRQSVNEELKIHQELQRQKDLEALER